METTVSKRKIKDIYNEKEKESICHKQEFGITGEENLWHWWWEIYTGERMNIGQWLKFNHEQLCYWVSHDDSIKKFIFKCFFNIHQIYYFCNRSSKLSVFLNDRPITSSLIVLIKTFGYYLRIGLVDRRTKYYIKVGDLPGRAKTQKVELIPIGQLFNKSQLNKKVFIKSHKVWIWRISRSINKYKYREDIESRDKARTHLIYVYPLLFVPKLNHFTINK